jgi:ParB family chromosome partitioning protein
MKVHSIKLSFLYFDAVATGKKRFEVRKNDRNYQVGDYLRMHEIDSCGNETGKIITAQVDYVLDKFAGLQDGYCVMSITLVDIA